MVYRSLSGPITCQIEIDDYCNNNCFHCYNHWRHCDDSSIKKMSQEILKKCISEILINDVFHVTITGGEPLLNKNILTELVSKLIMNQIDCALNSNLTLLTDQYAKQLYRIGLRGIMTSLFSHDENIHDMIAGRKGSFKDVIKGINIALSCGFELAVSMVVTNYNIDDIFETALFVKKLGINQFFATKASPPINSKDFQKHMLSKSSLIKTLRELYKLKEQEKMNVGILECYPLCSYKGGKYDFANKRSCSAGITTCTISTNGSVRACSHADSNFGNILKDSLKSIWNKMDVLRDGSNLPTECLQCKYLQNCTGGCRIDAKYCYGKDNQLDPYANPEEISEIILVNDNEIININETDLLKFNSDTKIRKEKDGVLIASNDFPGEPAYITYDTYALITSLKQPFTYEMFSKISGLEKHVSKQLCKMFLKDNVFTKHD